MSVMREMVRKAAELHRTAAERSRPGRFGPSIEAWTATGNLLDLFEEANPVAANLRYVYNPHEFNTAEHGVFATVLEEMLNS